MPTAGSMEASDRKAAAEARRLKILARQQDRITRITGTYSQGSNSSPTDAAEQPAAAAAAQQATASPASSSPAASAQNEQPAAAAAAAAATAAATAAAAPRPPAATKTAPSVTAGAAGTAAAAAGAPPAAARPRPSPSRAPPSPSPSASALGSTTPAAPPSPTPSFQALPEDNVPSSSSSSSAPSTFADQLRASTDKTRVLRCLSSLLLAYSIRYGMLQLDQLRLAPIPMLLISHTVLVVSAAALFGRGWTRAAQGNQAGSRSQVPLHLRKRDWLAFVPGLRPMMTAFSSWQALLASLWDDVGVYAFTFIFLSLLP